MPTMAFFVYIYIWVCVIGWLHPEFEPNLDQDIKFDIHSKPKSTLPSSRLIGGGAGPFKPYPLPSEARGYQLFHQCLPNGGLELGTGIDHYTHDPPSKHLLKQITSRNKIKISFPLPGFQWPRSLSFRIRSVPLFAFFPNSVFNLHECDFSLKTKIQERHVLPPTFWT